MLKRADSILIAFALLAVLAFVLLPDMNYVPTPTQIDQHADVLPFQVMPTAVEGVYGNYDIDAIVFRYTTGASDAITFKTQLNQQAATAGWTPLPAVNGTFRFERITPKGNRVFCGAEEVRVKLDPESKRVDVGWVQGDAFKDVASFSDTHESDWAETEVWPKLDVP